MTLSNISVISFIMKTICIGKIIKPFGLVGVLRCKSLTSFASDRFQIGRKLFLKNPKSGEEKEVELASFRDSGDYYFISFKGMEDINLVEDLVGYEIEIPEEEATLPEGYFHLSDLIGSKAINQETNEKIGEVIDVLSFASSSNLKIKEENGKICYVPFVMDAFIASIDVSKKEILIHVIPGLL
ncbi:MAG TPA: 16S rRNA processing protein RimM [Firmicutes bacterium]|nr:16S rRNA processing protein RimM [Bacillota bacterium]